MANKKKKSNVTKVVVILLLVLVLALLTMILLSDHFDRQNYRLIYEEEIKEYSLEYQLDPYLVAAIIHVESGNRTDAVSHKGALGLMQLMPSTAEWIAGKLNEEFDREAITMPESNIRYGCWYLRFLFDRFDSKETVCAAYNAGHNAVASWLEDEKYSHDGSTLSDIPYPETKNYVEKVMRAYAKYVKLYPRAFD